MDILAGLSFLLAVAALVRLQGLAAAQREQEARHRAEMQALYDELARLQPSLAAPPATPSIPPFATPPAENTLPNVVASRAVDSSAGWAKTNPRYSPLAPQDAAAVTPGATPAAGFGRPSVTLTPTPTFGRGPRLPSGSLFALGGALLVLVGMAFVLSQLARAGFFTPQMQWGLAALLAALLYALAGRAVPVVAEAMRGLGYGLAALCLGALSLRGVLGAGPVLGLVLLLSLLVGAHARARGGVLLVGVAALGAMFAAWLLADNLGLPYAQYTLLAVAGALLLCLHRLPAGKVLHPLTLTGLLPLGVLGLLVTAAWHGQLFQAAALLWALYLALAALGLHLLLSPDKEARPAVRPGAIAAVSLLLTGWLVTGLLAAQARHALWWGPLGWWGLFRPLSLLLPLLGGLGLVLVALRLRARRGGDPLREALLMVSVSALSAWLTLDTQAAGGLPLRLLPLAVLLALYGQWTAQVWWRWGGTVAAALLLLALPAGWPTLLLVVASLGATTRLEGRAGALLGLAAGVPLLTTVAGLLPAQAAWHSAAVSVLIGMFALALATWRWPANLSTVVHASGGQPSGGQPSALRVSALGLAVELALWVLGHHFAPPEQAAWPLLAFTLAGALLPGVLHLPGVARSLPLPPRLRAPLPRLAEWLGLLLWLLGLLALPLPELLKGALLLALALAWPLLRLAQSWPAPTALLLAILALMSASHALSLEQPAVGLGLLLLTLLGLAALFSAQGAEYWARRFGPKVLPWAAWPAGQWAALWGALLPLLSMDAAVLLAALLGADGVLRPHALSATLGLLLPGLAALWAAKRHGWLPLWTVGLVAFGLAATKLVAFDLDGLGLSVRGLGLTVVGLLLLGIGQLAPKEDEP